MILTVQIYTFPMNTGIENHTFLKETVFLIENHFFSFIFYTFAK